MRRGDTAPELLEYEWDGATGIATLVHQWPGVVSPIVTTEVQRRHWLSPEERAKLRP